jgi:hypothetical protein
MSTGQNYALVWFMYINRLIQNGHLKFDKHNPKVYLLDVVASSVFLIGRDVNEEPFLGVPDSLMPFFTEVDWVDVSFCRKIGYLFLEARNARTQMLHIAFGIKIRKSRLDVVCIDGKENPEDMRFNIKVFEQDPDNPRDVLFSDQHEMMGLSLREIKSTADIGSEMEAEDARTVLANSGVKGSFTSTTIKM